MRAALGRGTWRELRERRDADEHVHDVPGRSFRRGLHPSGACRPYDRAASSERASAAGIKRHSSRSEGRGVERSRSISGGVRVRASPLAIVRYLDREPFVRSGTVPAPRRPPRYPTLSSMLTRPCRQTNVDCRADAGEGPDGGVEDVVRREVGETPVREECEGIRVHHRRRPGAQDAAPQG